MGCREKVQCRPNVVDHQDVEAGDRVVCPSLRRYYRGEASALQSFFKVPVSVARGGL